MKPAPILRRVKTSVSSAAVLKPAERQPRPSFPENARDSAGETPNTPERRLYYDPANTTLDLSKSNKMLVHEIKGQCITRTRLRIRGPANKWESVHGNGGQVGVIKEEAETAINGAKISQILSLRPLSVGDLVLLHNNSTLLYLVVAAPNSLASNVYTFINHEGEVVFGTKHSIKLRIPGVMSHARTENMNLVAIEEKRPGIAPIGVPDSAFSRKKVESEPKPQHRRQKSSAKTPESMLSPSEPASASLDAGPRDFTVQQASAQLLTDTTVNTYIVPTSAREVYSKQFTQISIDAFAKITDFGNRLDYVYRALQYDDSGNLISSARTVPLFQLFDVAATVELPPMESRDEPIPESALKTVSEIFRNSRTDGQSLGMALPDQTSRVFAQASFSASSYIAFISALSRSGRKWKINAQKSTKIPISVDVLPALQERSMETTLEYLKNGGIEEISSYIVLQMSDGKQDMKKPPVYESVIQILKDFVSGNVASDHTMDSLSGSLVRSINEKMKTADLPGPSSSQYAHEFARSTAYEILMALEKSGDRNPLRWNSALALPETNTSRDADRFLQFYKYIDSQFKTGPELLEKIHNSSDPALSQYLADDFYADDPVAAVREDFGDTPVYCIDSETAHEIDDGISIEDCGKKWAVTVHIANPTSYLKPGSSLSQIALAKGSTIYLPEGPTMMLPDVVSKLCGLNGEHQTRTLGVRFKIDKNDINDYHEILRKDPHAKPSDVLAEAVKKSIENTAAVKFYNVANFPKNFTYKRVNEVLNDAENVRKFHEDALAKGSHEHNLFHLHMIADLVRHFRVGSGSGIDVNSESTRVSVTFSEESLSEKEAFSRVENGWSIALKKGDKSDTPVISVTSEVNQNKDSKSQHLVSNLMIAANFAGSLYAKRRDFPIIHRHSELDVKPAVWEEIRGLNRLQYFDNRTLNPEQRSQLLSVMTSANFSTFQLEHNLLGLGLYSNLTSPLRRYVDMVNHWKFQDYVLKKAREKPGMGSADEGEKQLLRDSSQAKPAVVEVKKLIFSKKKRRAEREKLEALAAKLAENPEAGKEVESQRHMKKEFGMRTSDMDYIASHLQGCELKNRQAQKFSDVFWMAKFLRRYFELKKNGHIADPIEFSFLFGSDAKHGDIRAELLGFGALKTTIIQTPYVVSKFAAEEWTVGQVLKAPRFRVLKLDFIEGQFTVELVSPEEESEDIV